MDVNLTREEKWQGPGAGTFPPKPLLGFCRAKARPAPCGEFGGPQSGVFVQSLIGVALVFIVFYQGPRSPQSFLRIRKPAWTQGRAKIAP